MDREVERKKIISQIELNARYTEARGRWFLTLAIYHIFAQTPLEAIPQGLWSATD